MKKILILSICTVGILSVSCGGQYEKAEGEAASEMAEQMEDATIAGRNAAREFINKPGMDTIQIQNDLLEAKAKQSKFLMEQGTEKAAEFDSAFINTIRAVRPDLAKEILGK